MGNGLTWTYDTPVERISRNLGIVTGNIAFNNWSSANNSASDDISGYFLDVFRVVFTGDTETGGYTPRWNRSVGVVELYHIDDNVPNLASGPDVMVTVAVSGGNVGFTAFGLWR